MAEKLSFTFMNPNTPEAVVNALRAILLEKITSDVQPRELPAAETFPTSIWREAPSAR